MRFTTSLLNAGATLIIAQRSQLPGELARQAGVHWIEADLAQSSSFQAIAPGWIRSDLSDDYINSQQDPKTAWEGLYKMHPASRVGEPQDVSTRRLSRQ